MKYSEATQLKIDQLWEEIGKVGNDLLKVNMTHTFNKLLLFLDEDFTNNEGFLEKYIRLDAAGSPRGPGVPRAGWTPN